MLKRLRNYRESLKQLRIEIENERFYLRTAQTDECVFCSNERRQHRDKNEPQPPLRETVAYLKAGFCDIPICEYHLRELADAISEKIEALDQKHKAERLKNMQENKAQKKQAGRRRF